MTGLPEDVANLFASNHASGTDVNWTHIHALLAEEVATRQLQEPSLTVSNTGPRNGPKKRTSKSVSSPCLPKHGIPVVKTLQSTATPESNARRRITGKRRSSSLHAVYVAHDVSPSRPNDLMAC